MSDVRTRLIWTLQDNVSAGAAKLHGELDRLNAKSRSASGVLDKLSKATGGFVSPAMLAGGGALALGAALFSLTERAMSDEESQNRLRASLATNVAGFDGNTDAIERNIRSAQRLGFVDEDMRDALTVLVGATHDVSKAQEIMSTAMDLARFKGIDLKTASEALIKVEGGHYRMLAQLGINLAANATTTEALAAVQKVASGQAEAYATTNRGKLLASQIALDEALENLGYKTMPLVVGAMQTASQAATAFAATLDLITGAADHTEQQNKDLSDQIIEGAKGLGPFMNWVASVGDNIRHFGKESQTTGEHVGKMLDDIDPSVIKHFGAALHEADGKAADLKTTIDRLGKSASDNLDDILMAVYGPASLRGKESSLLTEIKDTRKAITEAKRTGKGDIKELRGHLADLKTELVQTWEKEAALGLAPESKEFRAWLKKQSAYIDGVYSLSLAHALYLERQLAGVYGNVGSHNYDHGAAGGGYRGPGWVGDVGEQGREKLIMFPGGGAMIVPTGGGSGGDSGGGGTVVNVNYSTIAQPSRAEAETFIRWLQGELYRVGQRAVPTLGRT